MPGYTIAPRETGCGDRPGTAHMGSQIRRSNGIRRNTAALNPNDAIELSKVSMTNLSSAGAETPCNRRAAMTIIGRLLQASCRTRRRK
jgi:hypothetical protein